MRYVNFFQFKEEQERKEREKLKKKEKIKKLKESGQYLTAEQKAKKARHLAVIQQLKEQGKTEKKPKISNIKIINFNNLPYLGILFGQAAPKTGAEGKNGAEAGENALTDDNTLPADSLVADNLNLEATTPDIEKTDVSFN